MPHFEWLALARTGGSPILRVWVGALVAVAIGWLIGGAIVLVVR